MPRYKISSGSSDNDSGGGFGGQYRNLVVTVSGVGYQGTITADRLIVESADFKTTVLRNINLVFNGENIGLNGLDAASISSSNWYYIFAIYNPTTDTTASLISLSATAPTLPSGYTMRCRVGAAYAPASTTAFFAQEQKDDIVSFGVNGMQGYVTLVNNGGASSITAFSTAAAAPATALSIFIFGYSTLVFCDGVSTVATIAANYETGSSTYIVPKSKNTLYYRSSNSAYVRALGYKDRL